jgi:formate/nitrite transporter FocA (FNT family)
MGFKHSIANWFFIPYGLMLDAEGAIPLGGAARNLAVVTGGNIVGGALLVAGIYWLAFLRDPQRR